MPHHKSRIMLLHQSRLGLPACILLLTAILLWPYQFELPGATVPNGAKWEPGRGLVFRTPGVASMPSPADIVQTGVFTLEVWAESFDPAQTGPARIVSSSHGIDARNFMLGQSGTAAVLRLRTTATDADGSATLDGSSAETVIPGVFDQPGLHHLLITDDLDRRRATVDGRLRLDEPSPGGSFANWSDGYRLLFGNEATGTRPWLGRIAGVSFHAGAEYRLTEQTDLILPPAIEKQPRPLQLMPYAEFIQAFPNLSAMNFADLFGNVLLFVPFGFLLRRSLGGVVKAVLVAVMFSVAMESAQIFLDLRTTSVSDVLNNLMGAVLGALLADRRPRREIIG